MSVEINATNFPDIAFRDFLSNNFDNDHDGLLNDEEILAVNSLSGSGTEYIVSLEGVQYLTNLYDVDIKKGVIERANFSGLPVRTIRFASCNSLVYLNTERCSQLKGIYLPGGAPLETLLVSDCPNLFRIYAINTNLTSLDLRGCTGLKFLDVENGKIESINLADNSNYRIISLNKNKLRSLTLPLSPYLHYLHVEHNFLNAVDTSNCPIINALRNSKNPSHFSGGCYGWYEESDRETAEDKNTDLIYLNKAPSAEWKYDYLLVDDWIVTGAPFIIESPTDVTAEVGDTVTFTAVFGGSNLSYVWYRRLKGGDWQTISGAKSNVYSFTATEALNGCEFMCNAIKNGASLQQKNSEKAVLTVLVPPTIYSQPNDIRVKNNGTGQFTIGAVGYELSYQWQESTDNGITWNDVEFGANEDTFAIVATDDNVSKIFRCKVSNPKGDTYSDSVKIITYLGIPLDQDHFPDSVFRDYISNYDIDNDGYLVETEIENITSISLNGPNWNPSYFSQQIASLKGIEYLTSLKNLELKGFLSLTGKVDAKTLIDLETISIVATNLEEVDLTGCYKLKEICLQSCPLDKLTLGDHPELERLNIAYVPEQNSEHMQANIGTIDLSKCPNLVTITADRAGLTNIDVTKCPKLEKIIIDKNTGIGAIDVTQNQQLRILETGGTNISEIDIRKCPKLKNLYDNYTAQRLGGITYYRASDPDNYPNESTPYQLSYNNDTTILSESIKIVKQPQSITVDEGNNATFSVEIITTESNISYQWEFKRKTDKDWNAAVQSNSEEFTVLATEFEDQSQYRCLVSCETAMVYSNVAMLSVYYSPSITINPTDQSVNEGSSAVFNVDASGSDLAYQWQCSSDDGETWTDIANETKKELIIAADVAFDGYRYRCKIENRLLTVYSGVAILDVVEDERSISPSLLTLVEGQQAKIEVIPKNDPNVPNTSYQWQSSSDGITWSDLRQATSDYYTVYATLSIDGMKYRCKVNNSFRDIYTEPLILTVTPDTSVTKPTITSQPTSITVAEGNNATFAVSANGSDISYQWQVFKNNQWQSITGETNSSYVISVSRGLNNSKYRCVVSNAAGAVYSNEATLTVSTGDYISTPRILMQPKSINADLGETVTFWVRAEGNGISYQWQKLNGSTWYDITGAIGSSYILIARTEIHNTQYRCVVTNAAGTVYSNSASLAIKAGQDLVFCGYHSIIISGKNTYGEWEMYPTSRPHVAPPEVKTSYVDLPGADGGLDYTDLLTGEPRYGYRKGTWEFMLIPQERWAAVYRSLVSFLHGRQHTVILEDDPNYVYTGRLSVNEWQSVQHNSLISIDYVLEPFPRNISGEEEAEQDAEALNAAFNLLNKEENAGMVIAKVHGNAMLIDPEMLFENGDIIAY